MDDLKSLQDLFTKRLFRIPDYQRGYSWANQQLAEFWEDIINLPTSKDHYTGMISLRKLDVKTLDSWNDEKWLLEDWGYNAFHIVDGQQRLTTFIILINELVNFYKELPENQGKTEQEIFVNSVPLSTIREEYLCITKPDSFEQLKTYKFGYEVDNPSYEFFKSRILEETNPGDIQETFYTLNLENAKKFFKKSLNEAYEKYGIEEISKLYVKLTQRLKFNIYNIDDDFNVFVAFETMNNRGKKLSNLELLKNRLIYLSTLFNAEEDVKVSVRNKINDTWKTVYGCLGKNKEKALNDDEYLQAHWIIYFGYTRQAKNDYVNFLLNKQFTQKRILEKIEVKSEPDESENDEISLDGDGDNEIEEITEQDTVVEDKNKLTIGDIGNYVDSMKNLIPFWYCINFPDKSNLPEEMKTWLDRINRIGFVYFKPLTTVVLAKENISDEDKIEYLKRVERFIFMHFRLAGDMSSFRNTVYYKLAYDLYHDNKDIKYVLDELDKIDGINESGILDIDAVINNIQRLFRNYKGYYDWSIIRYFLYEYETYITNEYEAPKTLYPKDIFRKDEKDKVSIEHVYPQTPTDDYWINNFEGYTDKQKKSLNGTLGNLLPLSLAINKRLQNIPFSQKKKRYKDGSHSEVEVSRYEEWNPENILERGKKMLNFMADRWGFKFKNEYDMLRLLGLEFMREEPEGYGQDDEDEDEQQRRKFQRTTTDEMIWKSYELAKEIYNSNLDLQDAVSTLEDMGMNSASAWMYLDCFSHMMEGKCYKRAISRTAVLYYVNKIMEDYGEDYKNKALEAVKQNYLYRKEKGYTTPWLKEWLGSQGISVD